MSHQNRLFFLIIYSISHFPLSFSLYQLPTSPSHSMWPYDERTVFYGDDLLNTNVRSMLRIKSDHLSLNDLFGTGIFPDAIFSDALFVSIIGSDRRDRDGSARQKECVIHREKEERKDTSLDMRGSVSDGVGMNTVQSFGCRTFSPRKE